MEGQSLHPDPQQQRVKVSMKIKGKNIEAPSEEVIVFPRNDGNIVFKAKPVKGYEDFDKVCPAPQPESIMKPGGAQSQDVENPKYKKALDDWAGQKTHWMILKSLSATDDLEWDTVDMSKPETYENYIKELEECGRYYETVNWHRSK